MRRRYSISFLIAALILMVLLKIGSIASFEKNKSNYTKVTGVVTAKYTKSSRSYSSRRRRHRITYLTVQYMKDGETKTIDNLRANFWETTGDTINLYVTPDDIVFRNTIMDSDGLYMAIMCIIWLVIYIRQRFLEQGGGSNKQQAVVGTVIDDYDFVPDKPVDTPADDGLTDYDTPEEPRLRMPVSEKPPFELYTEEEYEQLHK